MEIDTDMTAVKPFDYGILVDLMELTMNFGTQSIGVMLVELRSAGERTNISQSAHHCHSATKEVDHGADIVLTRIQYPG